MGVAENTKFRERFWNYPDTAAAFTAYSAALGQEERVGVCRTGTAYQTHRSTIGMMGEAGRRHP